VLAGRNSALGARCGVTVNTAARSNATLATAYLLNVLVKCQGERAFCPPATTRSAQRMGGHVFRNTCGILAMLMAMRRASSRVSRFAA
jgi:hypothetical protein